MMEWTLVVTSLLDFGDMSAGKGQAQTGEVDVFERRIRKKWSNIISVAQVLFYNCSLDSRKQFYGIRFTDFVCVRT